MPKVNEYSFAVISTEQDGKLHEHISHYVFKNINEANEFKTQMESDTADRFVILMLRNMKGIK